MLAVCGTVNSYDSYGILHCRLNKPVIICTCTGKLVGDLNDIPLVPQPPR